MAPRFSDRFLDDLRASITVLEYARRKHKVEKAGSEFRLADNHSLKIDPRKNIWGDFGSGNNSGGDVIAFERYISGCSFEDAVERIAQTVGMQIPGKRKDLPLKDEGPVGPEPPLTSYTNGANGAHHHAKRSSPREVTKTYDYVDPDGGLLYQTCRIEWTEPDGKKMKTFAQRRSGPNREWAWGLDEGLYLRSGINGEWYRATEQRLEKWRGAPQEKLEKVAHTLYRFDELREEMAHDPDERRILFNCEGEKDCETLESWGLFATTNSGGAKNWQPHFADEFSGADVVILLDNDKAGRERGHMIAGSLRLVAKRVRVLSWPDHWNGCPEKADVTDWRDQAGGTYEKFCAIIDKLPTWTPERPQSSFGAMMFRDLDKPGKELSWLVKGVLTEGEVSIWYGHWGSGKSFLITDCAMAIARGVGMRWMGNVVKPGLVIYQAGEGGIGFRKRLRAYRQHHHLPADDDIPFVLLPSRIDIFGNETDTDRLIAEIRAWAAYYDEILRLVVIDTFNAATPGADENTGRDMGPALNRARKIAVATGAHVAVVDHMPKDGGTPRGWSGKMGNVDSAIEVTKTNQMDRQLSEDGQRWRERPIHTWKVTKQKDEEAKRGVDFILPQVVLGLDSEGDKITSCIVQPITGGPANAPVAANRDEVPRGWAKVNSANEDLIRCLIRALRNHGRSAPTGIEAPMGEPVITISEWQAELLELYVGHEEVTPALKERLKKRVQRACKGWDAEHANLVGKHKEFVWRTGRKVHMIDPAPPPDRSIEPDEPNHVLAPGESMDEIAKLLI